MKFDENESTLCDPANPRGSAPVNIWQEVFPIRFGSIDRSDKLTLDAVFQFFQEAAICHAENLGVGREDLANSKQAWILSRITVIVDRRPGYGETVKVRTYPQGVEKLFAMRNYDIRDKSGAPVVRAKSSWLIVDIEKRRPLRPVFLTEKLPLNEELESLSPEEGGSIGLTEQSNLQKTMERKAQYTDIDFFGHVNNVRYIQWIEDALDPCVLEEAGKMRLDINYLNEILPGEVTGIFTGQIENDAEGAWQKAFAIEGRKENGQPAFRAELRLGE